MKIYGPFRGINNPVVMGMFGLEALDTLVKVHQAWHEGQQRDLLAHALTSGQVEPSEPGGPFRQGLSKLTSGLVSPDVQADPETILAERQAQQGQQEQKLKSLSLISNIRNSLGSGPFSSGSPLDIEQQRYGGSPGMMSGETTKEKTEADKVKQQEISNERQSPEGKAKAKQAELDVTNSPANVAKSLGIKAMGEREAAGIRESASLDEAARKAPLEIRTAAAKKTAELTATDDYTNSMPLPNYKRKTGTTFIDSDLNDVTSSYKGNVGTAQADKNIVPVAKGKNADQLADSRALVRRLEALRPIIQKYLPDTSKMNGPAASKALYEATIRNYVNSNKLSDLSLGYQAKLDAVTLDRKANGRFPGQKILDIPLLPEFGEIASGKGVMGMIGIGHTITQADDQRVALQKLDSAIARIKEGTTGLIKNDTTDEGVSDPAESDPPPAEATP